MAQQTPQVDDNGFPEYEPVRVYDAPATILTQILDGEGSLSRAIRTLMEWGVEVDEAMFLGGLDKSSFLKTFQPDFFFDDQTRHCESVARVAPAGHVISGVANVPSTDLP